jgi:hypothetical protein
MLMSIGCQRRMVLTNLTWGAALVAAVAVALPCVAATPPETTRPSPWGGVAPVAGTAVTMLNNPCSEPGQTLVYMNGVCVGAAMSFQETQTPAGQIPGAIGGFITTTFQINFAGSLPAPIQNWVNSGGCQVQPTAEFQVRTPNPGNDSPDFASMWSVSVQPIPGGVSLTVVSSSDVHCATKKH